MQHCQNNVKIKYQNRRHRGKHDTPNTHIHDREANTTPLTHKYMTERQTRHP
jgi:hypothetical protein